MVPPRRRLAAAALFALLLFKVWIWRTDLGSVDNLFGIAALAIPITLLWSSAVYHAFNLIDGVNGLSSGVAALAALGLGALALLALFFVWATRSVLFQICYMPCQSWLFGLPDL